MARQMNFEQKIDALKEKIEKKTEELKALKAMLADAEAKKTKSDFKALNEYLATKGISPEDAMSELKKKYEEA